MKNLTFEELIIVADALYRFINPNTSRCTPNGVYISVIEKWYPEYQNTQTNLDFFNWCLTNKK
jgi:hypothetical protein